VHPITMGLVGGRGGVCVCVCVAYCSFWGLALPYLGSKPSSVTHKNHEILCCTGAIRMGSRCSSKSVGWQASGEGRGRDGEGERVG
jgi:hypothetical protein